MENGNSNLVISAIVNKENAAELKEYLGSVMQIFGKNGGKVAGRYQTVDKLMGTESPEMLAIIEFPDAGTIKEMVSGEDFLALADMRARVFSKLNMMICGGL